MVRARSWLGAMASPAEFSISKTERDIYEGPRELRAIRQSGGAFEEHRNEEAETGSLRQARRSSRIESRGVNAALVEPISKPGTRKRATLVTCAAKACDTFVRMRAVTDTRRNVRDVFT